MEQWGNASFNLETVLKQNILNSDYFRNDCMKLASWSQLVDVVYEEVDYMEPWMGGNLRGPSTAFCLLYRLFQLKPTEEEVEATIVHEDSPYIRAVRGAQRAGGAG
jgi:pre-mRNA-splicing factor 38B